MTHKEKVERWLCGDKVGAEIGAFIHPLPGITPFYIDCFKEFGNYKVNADYYGHASWLPFLDNSLDYVVASHVLEHSANPISALIEWYRVVKPGGIIYIVVPDQRYNWDKPRKTTSIEHMLADFDRNTDPCDDTHIDEFVYEMDWSQFSPDTPAEDIPKQQAILAKGMHESVARGEQINIHFHVFQPASLLNLLERLQVQSPYLRWSVVDTAERFPDGAFNGFLVVLQANKKWMDRIQAMWISCLRKINKLYVLRSDAESFSDFTSKCVGSGFVRPNRSREESEYSGSEIII